VTWELARHLASFPFLGGTVAAATPQRVGPQPRDGSAAYPCAFGDFLSHWSEPDWHFSEKSMHLRAV
jgi:hypothetical protein